MPSLLKIILFQQITTYYTDSNEKTRFFNIEQDLWAVIRGLQKGKQENHRDKGNGQQPQCAFVLSL